MTYHYIYKTTEIETGKFYIGKRTSNVLPSEDIYYGSGTWICKMNVKNFKEKFKKEILCICNIEHLDDNEILYIEKNFNNDLCMNITKGGDGFGSGSNNINYDNIKYNFYDLSKNISITATQSSIINLYKFQSSIISRLVNGKILRHKNLCLENNVDIVRNKFDITNKIYEFYEISSGKKICATRNEMIVNYGTNKTISNLIKGKLKKCCGYSMWHNRYLFVAHTKKYEFYDIENDIVIKDTISNMIRNNNCSSHIHNLVRGKHKQVGGYCLVENKNHFNIKHSTIDA